MARSSRRTRLLFLVGVVPVLGGCAVLGEVPGTVLLPVDATSLGASPAPESSPADPILTIVASSDGYSLGLPTGWNATDLSGEDAIGLADGLAFADPTLGALARAGLEQSKARLSLIALDPTSAAVDPWTHGVVVATMRTRGMDKAAARTMVEDLLAQAPLLTDVGHTVEGLPAGDAHRYETVIAGDSGVPLALQVYVFRVGGDSFVVAAVAPTDQVASVQGDLDAIVRSLRFGL